jgi:hypothetical protein
MEVKVKRDGSRYLWNAFAIIGILFTLSLSAYILVFWIISSAFDISSLPSQSEQLWRFSRNRSSFEQYADDVAKGRVEFREDSTAFVKFVKDVPDMYKRLGISSIVVWKQDNWLLFEYASGPLDNNHYIVKASSPFDASRWHRVTNLTDGWYLVVAN